MTTQNKNILIGTLAAAAVLLFLFRDKVQALFTGQTPPPAPPVGGGGGAPADNGDGTTTIVPPVVTLVAGAPVRSKVADANVRNENNQFIRGPFSNGQFIGALVSNPPGIQYKIMTLINGVYVPGYVFKNEVTVG